MQDDTLFDTYLNEAIDNIPKEYADKLTEVAITSEEFLTSEKRAFLGYSPNVVLYGLFEGIPLPQKRGRVHPIADIITIYKHPMVDLFTDPERLRLQIYETLWHEIAHFFGLNHAQIDTILAKLKIK